MATITASLFAALDGVVDPGVGNWHFPYFNEEMGEAVGPTHEADLMLFGRVTYDSFAGAWPDREAAGGEDATFAKQLGDMRKIVVSHSPLTFTWRNSEQLQGELVDAVAALKADPAIARIAISGCVSVVRQLLDAGLLDELAPVRPPGDGGHRAPALRRRHATAVPAARLGAAVPHGCRPPRVRAGPRAADRLLRRGEGEPARGVTQPAGRPATKTAMDDRVETFAEGLDFGEGPRWHDGRLWVSDFYARHVVSFGPDRRPAGRGRARRPAERPRLVAVGRAARRRHDLAAGPAGGRRRDGAPARRPVRGRDGELQRHGRRRRRQRLRRQLRVRRRGSRARAHGNADLALVRPDGSVEVAAADVRFPNGSVITPDGGTLIVGESMGARLPRVHDRGRRARSRTAGCGPSCPGMAPDGCALDAEGGIWMADAVGSGCVRVARGW